MALGNSASLGHTNSIVIGTSATSTANNQLVIGSTTAVINDVYIGDGVTDATPTSFTFNATGGSGTDIAGADLTIAGGRGTGTGAGGDIVFQTATPGTTGTALNAHSVWTYSTAEPRRYPIEPGSTAL